MKFKIEIELGNAAFGTDSRPEVVRILKEIIQTIEDGHDLDTTIRDINGNTVGRMCLVE